MTDIRNGYLLPSYLPYYPLPATPSYSERPDSCASTRFRTISMPISRTNEIPARATLAA